MDPLALAPRDAAGLLAFVDRHRLAGIAARALRNTSGGKDPAPALAARQRRAALCALRHAAATVRVVQALGERSIEAIPLKGALLSDHLYGDPTIRDVRDADLLIRPQNLGEADHILLDRGYQRVWPTRVPPPGSRAHRRLLEHGYHFEYTHTAERVNIEVHWRFPGWSPVAVEAIWDSTESRIWRGAPMRALASDPLLLLLLCDHGARHRWFLLKWLVDIATLLPRIDDTAGLLRLARQLDVERPLGQAVVLCNRIFHTPIRGGLNVLAGAPECQWLADEASKSIQAPANEYFAGGRSLRRQLRLKLYERRLRTRNSTLRSLVRLDDIIALPLPDRWFWLYYPLRTLLWLQRRLQG